MPVGTEGSSGSMQHMRIAGFSVPVTHRAGAGQSAAPAAPGGTAIPLLLFTFGGLALIAGIAYAKDQLK